MTKKRRQQKIPNVWYAPNGEAHLRVTFVDEEGVRRAVMEKLLDEPLDADEIKAKVRDVKRLIARRRAGAPIESPPANFSELCDRYASAELTPAVFQNGRKIAGKKDLRQPLALLKMLKAVFGYRNIKTISYNDLQAFKNTRLNTPVRRGYDEVGTPRKIATVNRELNQLRTVFTFAVRSNWLDKNPFHGGKPLIKLSDEVRRRNVLSLEEEARLLALCTERKLHLRLIIIATVNGGFRRGELTQMLWREVDFDKQQITLPSENTKDGDERVVPFNAALKEVFEWWRDVQKAKNRCAPGELVLGGIKDVKTAWLAIRAQIGREDIRLHDLRATCATRLLNKGIPESTVAELLGHSGTQILRNHYTRVSTEDVRKAMSR